MANYILTLSEFEIVLIGICGIVLIGAIIALISDKIEKRDGKTI